MKNPKILMVLLLFSILLISACNNQTSEYTILITGNNNCNPVNLYKISFTGTIGSDRNVASITGHTCERYQKNGVLVYGSIHKVIGKSAFATIKKSEEGYRNMLRVTIMNDEGEILAEQSTESPYGVVTVSSE